MQANIFSEAVSVLFLDRAVDNYLELLAGVKPGIKTHILNSKEDGIQQITHILETQYSENFVKAVHIVSHGSPGCLYLGNTQLSLDTLKHYTEDLQAWFSCQLRDRNSQPSLLLYGCQVAAGDAGEEFVTKLHRLTGAEIAASTTLTGNAALGGNWHLEAQTRSFEKIDCPFSCPTVAAYSSVLITPIDNAGLVASFEDLPDDTSNNYTVDGTNYNFQVGGENNLVITGFNASPNGDSEPYSVLQTVDQINIQRVNNDNVDFEKDVFWYELESNIDDDINLSPSAVDSLEDVLLSDVINRGADNLFANAGDANVNNIERVDFVANGGLSAPVENLDDVGFLLLERGGNDPFQIAAITEVDASGNPTAFGDLVSIGAGDWGNSQFDLTAEVLNELTEGADPSSTSTLTQTVAGVFISYSDLGITADQTFFGYAVFPNDITADNDLVNLTDFPTDTSGASGEGGLDLIASGSVFIRDAVNNLPIAGDDTATALEDDTVNIAILDNDDFGIDGAGTDPITVTTPLNGSAVVNDAGTATDPTDDTIDYTPDAGFTGTDTFTYTITDADGDTSTASVTVTVTSDVNDIPTATDDAATASEDNTVNISVLGNDDFGGDGAGTGPIAVTPPANGSAVINDGGTATDPTDDTIDYTPDPDFNGTDTFTYTITDSNGDTATATVTVTVTPVDDIVDDAETTPEDTPVDIPVLANDSFGPDVSVTDVSDPTNGTVTINDDGTVTYEPDPDFNG
ncbi:MAG: DUF4347 domain-containing protein, partial [Cyanobacteria bacterium P01_F01_bin.86]